MKIKKIIKFTIIVILTCFGSILLIISARFMVNKLMALKSYNERIQKSYIYSENTEPLPRETIEQLCTSFNLNTTDVRCKSDSVVYGPDFFPEITALINDSPEQTMSRQTIENKIGQYLIRCGIVDKEGDYRCRYDLNGDGLYPIFIYYSDNDFAYRIIANIGGS